MTRGPRPHRALAEAIPIAKERGIAQLVMSGPERIFDIAIVSKVPVTFARIMFAPAILAGIPELADYFNKEITAAPADRPRRCHHSRTLDPLKARDMAVLPGDAETAWSRSIARGNGSCQNRGFRTRQGLLSERRDYPTPEKTIMFLPGTPEPQKGPVVPLFPLHPVFLRS